MLSCLWFGSVLTVVRTEAAGFCPAATLTKPSPSSVSVCSEFGEEGFGFDVLSIPGAYATSPQPNTMASYQNKLMLLLQT